MTLKQRLFALWISALLLNTWAWYHVDWFFDRNRTPRAMLVKTEGLVKTRPQELTLWRPAGTGRKLYGDEILATEDLSNAMLKFQGGRTIQLGPNTQLALGKPQDQSDSKAMVIRLLRGNATVSTAKNTVSDQSLNVQSGNSIIQLNNKERSVIELSKSVKKDDADIVVKYGSANLLDSSTGQRKKINKNTHSKKEEPKKEAPPEDPKPILGFLPQTSILWPQSNMTLWTTRPLNDRRGFLPVRTQTTSRGDPTSWENYVILGNKQYPIRNNQADIPIDFLRKAKATTLGYRIQLTAGAHFIKPLYQTNQGQKKVQEEKTISFEIRSLLALPAKVRITLPSVRTESVMASGWFLQRGQLTNGLTINIYSHSDIVRMAPVLNAAKRFHILAKPPAPRGKGMYLSRKGKIIASVENAQDLQDLRTLKRVLKADVVFYGNSQALLPLTLNPQNLQNKEQVFVVTNGQIKPVRTELLLEEAARRFVLNSVDGIFLEPVQVMGDR